jgi:hypothetical protein
VGRRAAVLAVLCALAAGCGGGGSDGHALLNRTLGSLGRIGSGNLEASLLLRPRGIGGKTEGVELSGPFALPHSGSLPVARLAYTRVDGPRRTSLTLLSTGDRAFVERDGKAYELGRAQVDQLGSAVDAVPGTSRLLRMRVDDWVESPKRAPCGSLGAGEDVECVQAGLDAETFLSDLLGAAQLLGRGSSALSSADPAELARAVRSGTVRVAAGRQDGLFRALAVDMDFGPTAPAGLSTLLGSLAGAHLHVQVGLSAPNRPVIVPPPPNPLPLSELSGGG